MSSEGIVVADDIRNLLEEVERARGSESKSFTAPFGTYYASSIVLSEPRASRPARMPQDRASMASAATLMSTIFDTLDDYSTCSASTAPPLRGPEPRHRQRLPVPDSVPASLQCEFRYLPHCDQRFGLDEVETWIQHITVRHLRGLLPTYCICWFCDHFKFPANSGRREDRDEAYRMRMLHIASHFREGKKAFEVRWDFHFLDHVHSHGLITEEAFQRAARQSEVRMPREITFFDPRMVRPRVEILGEKRRRRF